MADDAKAEEMTDQIRDKFAETIRQTLIGTPPHLALQCAATLCAIQAELLAGMRITYRALPAVDATAILEDWRRGLSIREITNKHQCSRVTAYKHHPNKTVRRAKSG